MSSERAFWFIVLTGFLASSAGLVCIGLWFGGVR